MIFDPGAYLFKWISYRHLRPAYDTLIDRGFPRKSVYSSNKTIKQASELQISRSAGSRNGRMEIAMEEQVLPGECRGLRAMQRGNGGSFGHSSFGFEVDSMILSMGVVF